MSKDMSMGSESTRQESDGKHLGLVNHIEQAYERRRGMREQEAAAYMGVSVKTLQAWRFQGRGPKYSKMGGRAIIYTREWCDEFRDAGVVMPIGDAQ